MLTLIPKTLVARLSKFLNLDEKLAQGLSISMVGFFATSILLFVANLILARTISPTNYGLWTIVQTIGYLLAIPFAFGQDVVMIRHAGVSSKKHEVVGSSLVVILISLLLFGSMAFLGRQLFANTFKLQINIWFIAVGFGAAYSLKNWGGAIWRCFKEFKKLTIVDICCSLLVLLGTIGMLVTHTLKMENYAILICLTFSLSGVWWWLQNSHQIVFKRSVLEKWFKPLLGWGAISLITGFTGFAVNGAEKLILNNYSNPETVGLYGIYASAASQLLYPFATIFTSVLMPLAAETKNKMYYLKMINLLIKKYLGVIIMGNLIMTWVIVKLYGSAYPIIFLPLFLIVFAVSLNLTWQLRVAVMSTMDIHAFTYGTLSAVVVSLISLIVHFIFIPRLGLVGISFGLLTTSVGSFVAQEIYFQNNKSRLEGAYV
ncbi:MAG: oligosaccharide flippase family protein [Desulfobacteraceae bacterium]|jgi:O-antigen/teichoic acid export membrane protein